MQYSINMKEKSNNLFKTRIKEQNKSTNNKEHYKMMSINIQKK